MSKLLWASFECREVCIALRRLGKGNLVQKMWTIWNFKEGGPLTYKLDLPIEFLSIYDVFHEVVLKPYRSEGKVIKE